MFTSEERFFNSIDELECAENYEENSEIFDNAISILKNRLASNDFSEFSDNELETLVKAYSLMEE